MSSATENYERLNEILNRLVYPTCEKILENYLKAHSINIFKFLEIHKHRILHCFRVKPSCCHLHANCNYPKMATLNKRQWNFMYNDNNNEHCTKHGCVCHVVPTIRKFRNMNLNVICFLIIEFSMVDGLDLEAVRRIKTFNQEMNDTTTGLVKYEDYQRKWNSVTDSLMVLGVTQKQIDKIMRLKFNRTPSPPPIDDRVFSFISSLSVFSFIYLYLRYVKK